MVGSNEGESKVPEGHRGWLVRQLDRIEWLGNKLPDPAVLFLIGLGGTWLLSAFLAGTEFQVPGKEGLSVIASQLSSKSLADFVSGMVKKFTDFHPLGVVLVALLGVGIAEHAGFINACLKSLLIITPRFLLTPMLVAVALVSHTAADAGYVLVIPIGGVMFYAAGRHPLAGIAAAFAGVSGGFSANFLVSGLDPLLAGLTKEGAALIDPDYSVNALCNYYFTASSSLLIIVLAWLVTDLLVEPRLASTLVDADKNEMPKMAQLSGRDLVAMVCGLVSLVICLLVLVLWAWPEDSALRANGSLTSSRPQAPLMGSIVPLIFLLFAIPGIVHGYVSGTFQSHRDIVRGMSKSMETMGYYLVLVFFAALFIDAFSKSNIGVWLAVSGADLLKSYGAANWLVLLGVIGLTASVNLLIGSASAKRAMLSPIFVPMLMMLGVSPEMTQAAYRVGDSTTNIITPMMPYFPLVVVYCQKYVRQTGIGTVAAMMLPYSFTFLVCWSIYLLIYWQLGLPLGIGSGYDYVPK
ncbi:MAG TPA: aminobenzoyl-glutamate transporter [Planctomycetaceae bacterium]|nr:aminobenzoyl-glutamate transporter [Planctomycetaceae bacterium]